MGNFFMADSRSWSSDQAKFMRIRVDIPLDKPLRHCGVIASLEGEIYQVYFRYGRLPVFYFSCGIMRRDERHCQSMGNPTNEPQQYGEWLRAQGRNKMGSLKIGPAKAAMMPIHGKSTNFRGNKAKYSPEGRGRSEERNHEAKLGGRKLSWKTKV